jgi:tryptophan-rich sensory protein
VSLLGVTAALATALGRQAGPARIRTVTIGTVLVAGLLTVAVIGAPGLGRDFGGVLAALPGFLLLAMLLGGIRVTLVRLAAILGAAVAAVGIVAVLDWRRPPTERTHLGRFVDQAAGGEAWTVISRKGQANLDILMGSPLAWMLPVALVAAVWLLRPGGLLRSGPGAGPGGLPAADAAVVRATLIAVLLSLVIGAAVNDSGVALPATAAALLVPLLIWLAAAPGSGGTGTRETADGTPRSGPGEQSGRVTVVSRGSTVSST